MALRIGRTTATGGGGFSIKVVNLREVISDLEEEFDDVIGDIETVMPRAMEKHVKKPSQRLCPKDTGDLRKSAYVSVTRKGKNIEALVGYKTHYAIFVHEILSAYHKPPTMAKFLEAAIAQNIEKLHAQIDRDVRRMQ